MYTATLGLHNLVRWLVIVVGLYATIIFWRGWLQGGSWSARESRASRLFVTALDIQFLVGVVMYVFVSPLTRKAFSDVGAAMGDPSVRYFLVDHVVIMLAAIVVAHVGSARVKRATTDVAKLQTAALWFGVAVAAILGFVPWSRPLMPSF